MKIVRDIFGNRIQEIPLNMGLDYYDVNIGLDMGVVLTNPAGVGQIEVVNDIIPFPEEIDEAEEGMRVYAIQLDLRPEDYSTITGGSSALPQIQDQILDFHIGFFEFEEVEVSGDYTTDLLEEMEERLASLRVGYSATTNFTNDGTTDRFNFQKTNSQLSDAVIFDGGFEFPLNPSVKIIHSFSSNDFIDVTDLEDRLTMRIFYKKVRRSRGLFDRILALFRQNIDT